MGLILPQKLTIKWATTSKQHYINLGYSYTKIGDLFEVDVKDLSHGSTVLVDVRCDFCDNVEKLPYRAYLKLKSNKYCCPECLSHKKKTRNDDGELEFVEVPYRNRKWLHEEYIIKDRTAEDIANDYNINPRTLREWINAFNLNKKQGAKTSHITKDVLNDLYIKQKLTTLEIGRIFDVTDGTILSLLYKYNIPIPNRSELMRRYYYEKGGIEKFRYYGQKYENRVRISCIQRGLKVKDFNGFVKSENDLKRKNSEYREWRLKIFKRDNFTCQCCNKRGGNLNAHHIKNFSDNEYLRLDIDNGITLCEECHLIKYPNSFHSIYGQKNNTLEQLNEFIKNKQLEMTV